MTVTLPQNTRDTVLDALEVYLTAGLVDVWGSGRKCSRDPNDLNDDVQGEETPRLYIKEGDRSRPDDMMIQNCDLEIIFLGLVRRKGYTDKLIQTELNKLELFLDYMLCRISRLGYYTGSTNYISVSLIQKPGQASLSFAGQDEGWLEYHASLNYPEALA